MENFVIFINLALFFLSTLPITMDLILQCKNLNEEKIDETLSGLLLL